jgi:hypothetical protein
VASDAENDTLTFSITNKPGWASFNTTTGRLSGTPAFSNAGEYAGITIRVTDGNLSASLPAFTITVTAANRAPTISGTAPLNATVGDAWSFTPNASDPDGDTLTFSIQNRPGWASFNSTSGRLSGTPEAADIGTFGNIRISVTDGDRTRALSAFSITVNQSNNGSITLSWTPPSQNTDGSPLTNLAGYRIYYGTAAGSYPNQIVVNNPGLSRYVVENLSPGTYYFVSTAVNSQGVESDFSNMAEKTVTNP